MPRPTLADLTTACHARPGHVGPQYTARCTLSTMTTEDDDAAVDEALEAMALEHGRNPLTGPILAGFLSAMRARDAATIADLQDALHECEQELLAAQARIAELEHDEGLKLSNDDLDLLGHVIGDWECEGFWAPEGSFDRLNRICDRISQYKLDHSNG